MRTAAVHFCCYHSRTMADPDASVRTPAQKIALAVAILLAIAAIVIELLVLFDRLPSSMGTIGGSLIILSLAISVIGRAVARRTPPPST